MIPTIVKHKIDPVELKKKVDQSGAVLLRGFDVDTIEKFSNISKMFGSVDVDMSCSAGPRIDMGHNVFTSNEAPPNKPIPVHHEMAQCVNYPSYILFYCMIPPTQGGCTPIIKSSAVCNEFQKKFEKITARIKNKGVRYLRQFPSTTDHSSPLGKSWKDTFGVKTRCELEKVLTEKNVKWKWLENNDIETISEPMQIFKKYNDEEIIFMAAETSLLNQSTGPMKKLLYGDLEEFDEETSNAFIYIGEFAYIESSRIPWEKFDVLILNNNMVMHSRDPFVGERKILVSLVK